MTDVLRNPNGDGDQSGSEDVVLKGKNRGRWLPRIVFFAILTLISAIYIAIKDLFFAS